MTAADLRADDRFRSILCDLRRQPWEIAHWMAAHDRAVELGAEQDIIEWLTPSASLAQSWQSAEKWPRRERQRVMRQRCWRFTLDAIFGNPLRDGDSAPIPF